MATSSSLKKFGIVLGTLNERLGTRISNRLRPPAKSRKFGSSIEECVRFVLDVPLTEIDGYVVEVRQENLIEEIRQALDENIPSSYGFVEVPSIEWQKILENIYALIRIIKPRVIVETCVGLIGGTSSYILSALGKNKEGHLYSIDPDKFYSMYGFHVGSGIPDRVRSSQTLINGYSQRVLSGVLRKHTPVDIFLHDGDHRYKTKLFEYEQARSFLSPSGIILSDDTNDSAFDTFLLRNNMEGISYRYSRSCFGFGKFTQK